MAEIVNERQDQDGVATLATARESLAGGYEPYVGFANERNEKGLDPELAVLIDWYGEDHELAYLLTDGDWNKHARCTLHARDPQ
jgi:hypothetical protein